jgi:hypothetical protein
MSKRSSSVILLENIVIFNSLLHGGYLMVAWHEATSCTYKWP